MPVLTKETQDFNKEHINMMKPAAFFINTARAGLVDEDALVDALAGTGLAEPPDGFPWNPFPRASHTEAGQCNINTRAGNCSNMAAISWILLWRMLSAILEGTSGMEN